MEKTESKRIELTNHEKAQLRKLIRLAREQRIKQEDAEDAPFRRKITK